MEEDTYFDIDRIERGFDEGELEGNDFMEWDESVDVLGEYVD